MKLTSLMMKLFSHNETNLGHNETFLIYKSGENPCGKPLLTKRKGTQVLYQYLCSNMNYNAFFDTKVSWCIWVHHSAVLVQS